MGHVGLRYLLDTQMEMLIGIRYMDLKLRKEEVNPECKSVTWWEKNHRNEQRSPECWTEGPRTKSFPYLHCSSVY